MDALAAAYPGQPIEHTATDPRDNLVSTRDTITIMTRLALESAKGPGVQAATQNALAGAGSSTTDKVSAIWQWVKGHLRFRAHEDLVGVDAQLLISPELLVSLSDSQRLGDCANYSPLVAAMLIASGLPLEIYYVTLAANISEPGIFTHVYVGVVLPTGNWMALDASHGLYAGWEAENLQSKRVLWPVYVSKGDKRMIGLGQGETGGYDPWGATGNPYIDTSYIPAGGSDGGWLSNLLSSPVVVSAEKAAAGVLGTRYAVPQLNPGQYIQSGKNIMYQVPQGTTAGVFPQLGGNLSPATMAVLAIIAIGGIFLMGRK